MDLKETTCRGCGKKVFWAKTRKGKNIPLDVDTSVFDLTTEKNESKPVVELNIKRSFAVHFATCPAHKQAQEIQRTINSERVERYDT